MKMLLLLGIIAVLFIMANKSDDQDISDVVNEITTKSEKIIGEITQDKVKTNNLSMTTRSSNIPTEKTPAKKRHIVVKSTGKAVTPIVTETNKEKITKRSLEVTNKSHGGILGADVEKLPLFQEKNNLNASETTKQDTTQSEVNAVPPILPGPKPVEQRRIKAPKVEPKSRTEVAISSPSREVLVEEPDPEAARIVRQKEKKFFNQAARALMSITE
tara:strand:- start:1784 stop:2431 length:648 start_codon:yes stop_codon:yes gene_type:complete